MANARTSSQIRKDFQILFDIVKSNSNVYSWNDLAKVSGFSKSKINTSFNYYPVARNTCERIFNQRLAQTILIVDSSILISNYDYLLDKHFHVPGRVFRLIKSMRADSVEPADTVYHLLTTHKVVVKEYDPALKRLVNVEKYWGQIDELKDSQLPVEPTFGSKSKHTSVSLVQASVINLAIHYMEFGSNVMILTSSIHLKKLVNSQCDYKLPPKDRLIIPCTYIPPSDK